jgi:quercetin dioxygenase-like cupin family protein
MGYQTDRCVTPPGAHLGDQRFGGEILLLVLFGRVMAQSNGATIELASGDRLHVPSGVPFTLRVEGETSAYWIQAFRADPTDEE